MDESKNGHIICRQKSSGIKMQHSGLVFMPLAWCVQKRNVMASFMKIPDISLPQNLICLFLQTRYENIGVLRTLCIGA